MLPTLVIEGWEFFQDPFWRGPKPTAETTFEISLVGDERRWRVKAGKLYTEAFSDCDHSMAG